MLDNKAGDSIWHALDSSFIPWYFSDCDSDSKFKQVLASAMKIDRWLSVKSTGLIDRTASSFVNLLFPGARDAMKYRELHRNLFMMKRNGGVWADAGVVKSAMAADTVAFDIYRRGSKPNSEYIVSDDKLWHKPVTDSTCDFLEMRGLFEHEFSCSFESVFRSVLESPMNVYDDTTTYDARMHDGRNVTITVLSPARYRMRCYDLMPLRLCQGVVDAIGMERASAYLEYCMFRLDYDLGKEAKARTEILASLGVDVNDKDASEKATKAALPVYVPPPVLEYCSKHIMVTAEKPGISMRKVQGSAGPVVNAAAKLLFNSGLMIPGIGPENLKSNEKRISFERFAPLVHVDRATLKGIASLVVGSAGNDTKLCGQAAEILGSSSESIDLVGLERRRDAQLMMKNAPIIYAGAELRANLFRYSRESGATLQDFAEGFASLVGGNPTDVTSYLSALSKETRAG